MAAEQNSSAVEQLTGVRTFDEAAPQPAQEQVSGTGGMVGSVVAMLFAAGAMRVAGVGEGQLGEPAASAEAAAVAPPPPPPAVAAAAASLGAAGAATAVAAPAPPPTAAKRVAEVPAQPAAVPKKRRGPVAGSKHLKKSKCGSCEQEGHTVRSCPNRCQQCTQANKRHANDNNPVVVTHLLHEVCPSGGMTLAQRQAQAQQQQQQLQQQQQQQAHQEPVQVQVQAATGAGTAAAGGQTQPRPSEPARQQHTY